MPTRTRESIWTSNIASIFRSTAIMLIFTELAGVISNVIDGVVSSRFLGSDVYSAIALVGPFTGIVGLFSAFLSVGCSITCSHLVGVGEKEDANEVFNTSVCIALLISAVLAIACVVVPSFLLTICGVPLDKHPELNVHMYSYLNGIKYGIPALMMSQVMGPIIIMDGCKRIYTTSSVVLCVSDIVGDLLNVFVFHGGAFGMGVATSLSFLLQLLVLLPHFLKGESYFRLARRFVRFSRFATIARGGTPSLVKGVSGTVRNILVNYINIMVALSTAAIAARGIQSDLFILFLCIPTGFGSTLVAMVGVYYSANDLQGLRYLYAYAVRLGALVSLAVGALVFVLAPVLTGIYTSDPEVLELATFSVRWMAVALPFFTSVTLVQQYLQGTKMTARSNALGIIDRFALPVLSAFALGTLFGSKGILAGVAISEMLVLVVIFIASCVKCRGIPQDWVDVLFLPKDFGGAEEDNLYGTICSTEDVTTYTRLTNAFCLDHGADERTARLMSLFVEEMCLNSIGLRRGTEEYAAWINSLSVEEMHVDVMGLAPSDGKARADFRLFVDKDRRICFSLMDLGEQLDPTTFYELSEGEELETNVGVRLVMKMAKEVRYFSTFGSNNLIVYVQ